MSLLTQICEIDVPDSQGEYLRCLDSKLQQRWPGMTAVKMRLLQATVISFLIGGLAFSLEGNVTFAIGAVVVTNFVLLADVAAVASIEVTSSGLKITMQDEDSDE